VQLCDDWLIFKAKQFVSDVLQFHLLDYSQESLPLQTAAPQHAFLKLYFVLIRLKSIIQTIRIRLTRTLAIIEECCSEELFQALMAGIIQRIAELFATDRMQN